MKIKVFSIKTSDLIGAATHEQFEKTVNEFLMKLRNPTVTTELAQPNDGYYPRLIVIIKYDEEPGYRDRSID